MREYETDRWRIISTKVGSGFSPAACKEKAIEIVDPSQQGGSSHQQHSSLGDLGDLETGGEDDDGQDDSPIYDHSGHGGMVHGLGGVGVGEVHGGLGLGGHGHGHGHGQGGHGHEGEPGSASSEVGPGVYQ